MNPRRRRRLQTTHRRRRAKHRLVTSPLWPILPWLLGWMFPGMPINLNARDPNDPLVHPTDEEIDLYAPKEPA